MPAKSTQVAIISDGKLHESVKSFLEALVSLNLAKHWPNWVVVRLSATKMPSTRSNETLPEDSADARRQIRRRGSHGQCFETETKRLGSTNRSFQRAYTGMSWGSWRVSSAWGYTSFPWSEGPSMLSEGEGWPSQLSCLKGLPFKTWSKAEALGLSAKPNCLVHGAKRN